jgi:DNA-binding LacI/PurR family transcriptional regulator
MKTTIYDVAREAGVSIATVSKVINNTGRISEKTRRKVHDVMERLHYQPSMVASALTGKRTGTIGLLVPNIANPYFGEVARNIEDWAQKQGFGVVICSTDRSEEKTEHYLSLLSRKRVDGFIIASYIKLSLVEELLKEKTPLVLFSIDLPSLAVSTVSIDDYRGGFQSTSHLLSLGHKKIGVIAEDLSRSSYRVQGYKDAIKGAGIKFTESVVIHTEATIENGAKAAEQLFHIPSDRPTAIMACNDILAIGAMRQAQSLGIKVPEELSIIGFDNTILAEIASPPLTSIAQPIKEMTRQAIMLLLEQMDNEAAPKQRVLMLPQMIMRHSTTSAPPCK